MTDIGSVFLTYLVFALEPVICKCFLFFSSYLLHFLMNYGGFYLALGQDKQKDFNLKTNLHNCSTLSV